MNKPGGAKRRRAKRESCKEKRAVLHPLFSALSPSITGLTAPGMVMLLLKSAKIRLKLKDSAKIFMDKGFPATLYSLFILSFVRLES